MGGPLPHCIIAPVSFFLGGLLLQMTGSVSDLSEGRRKISDAVIGGAALSKFQAMMEAQGVANDTARSLCSAHSDYYSVLRKAEHQMELKMPTDGIFVYTYIISACIFYILFYFSFYSCIFCSIVKCLMLL